MDPEYQYLIKLIQLGDFKVGKSQFLIRFSDGQFYDDFYPTIGVDFKIKTINVDGIAVKVQVWDTAGAERFRQIIQTHYEGKQGIIFFFDITNRESFVSLEGWIKDVDQINTSAQRYIIGTKKDLEQNRQVQYEEALTFANLLGVPYLETSAKNDENVQDAFMNIVKMILPTLKNAKQ